MKIIKGYVDQHPDALRLTLVDGRADESQFQAYARKELSAGGVRVEATIIGASHLVVFGNGSLAVSEILACAELPAIPNWSIGDLSGITIDRDLPGLARYQFAAWREAWTDPEPWNLRRLMLQAEEVLPYSFGLVHRFPQGDLDVAPKTVVLARIHPESGEVIIQTAHSYPNVSTLIMSRTAFNPVRG